MKNIIRINKASFYAYHGVFREEQAIGGKFEADIELYTDFSEAASRDDLKQTVNYETVYGLLHDVAMSQKFYLIESLANRITRDLFKHFSGVYRVIVRVRKNNPPIGGVVDSVEVEVDKTREEHDVRNGQSDE